MGNADCGMWNETDRAQLLRTPHSALPIPHSPFLNMIAKQRILTDEMVAEIKALFGRYPTKQAVTLPALHIVNDKLRCVPLEAVVEIAELLDLAPAVVQDTLSFYGLFKQDQPHGKVRAWVCRSISCAYAAARMCLRTCATRPAFGRAKRRRRCADLGIRRVSRCLRICSVHVGRRHIAQRFDK